MNIHRLSPARLGLFCLFLTSPALAQPPGMKPAPPGLKVHTEEVFPGYTLYSPIGATFVLLLDLEGEVVHRWETDFDPTALYLLDSGNLLVHGHREQESRFKGPGVRGGVMQEIDRDGKKLWEYHLHDDRRLMHHDVAVLPDGNILIIVWEHVSRDEAIALGRDPEHVDDRGMWFDAVYELKPTRPEGAEIVWEWRSRDHLIQDRSPDLRGYGSIPDHPERLDVNGDHRDRPPLTLEEQKELEDTRKRMAALGYTVEEDEEEEAGNERISPDWLHTNAVNHHPVHDLLVLSTPHFGELWVIDHSTTTAEAKTSSGGNWGRGGDILWRWGNPRTYGAGTDEDTRLFYQHDPTWLDPENRNELRLLLFNNGSGRKGPPYSSVEELVLPFSPGKGFTRAAGSAFGPEKPAWIYSSPGKFFSPFISGCHRLPNGNTFVCSGVPGRLFEVTREGKIVWDFGNPHKGKGIGQGGPPPTAVFRATRVRDGSSRVGVVRKVEDEEERARTRRQE